MKVMKRRVKSDEYKGHTHRQQRKKKIITGTTEEVSSVNRSVNNCWLAITLRAGSTTGETRSRGQDSLRIGRKNKGLESRIGIQMHVPEWGCLH